MAGQFDVALHDGTHRLEVVGESHYQSELWFIVGGVTNERVRHSIHAVLVPQDGNRYDPNAIGVWIDGLLVGYLSGADAAAYRPGLLALQERDGRPVALAGVVAGGGDRGGSRGSLGVFLDHDPQDFGISPPAATERPRSAHADKWVSAGQSSVWDNMPGDDLGAIKHVRKYLESASDPVSRHFAFAELGRRLYKSRDAFQSALTEYDQVCEDHHNEMGQIAPALAAEFDGLPRLELYKQACIRHQKAQRWADVEVWAARGLAIYGTSSLDPSNLEDLEKRLAKALSKLGKAPAAPPAADPPDPAGNGTYF